MAKQFLEWLIQQINTGNEHNFYICSEWLHVRAEVMSLDRNECQLCKAKGRYKQAEIVHHVNHLKRRPDLALSIWYTNAEGEEERNLISVCKDCHETVCHPERLRKAARRIKTLFPERWD